MLRTLSAAALLISLAGIAHASDFSATVRAPEGVLHAKLVEAARQVCREAVAKDVDGAYGDVEDCVADTLALTAAASSAGVAYSAR